MIGRPHQQMLPIAASAAQADLRRWLRNGTAGAAMGNQEAKGKFAPAESGAGTQSVDRVQERQASERLRRMPESSAAKRLDTTPVLLRSAGEVQAPLGQSDGDEPKSA